jgi:eukaryotic-like serine/threonine-protein kinase
VSVDGAEFASMKRGCVSYQNHLPAIGELIGGKYQLVRELGAGGMGVVFEALHRDTEKRVALKFLSAELSGTADARARFVREARATGRVHHPNVVTVHDSGEHDGRVFMVLELLEGKPLREWLAKGPLPFDAACRLLFPAMRGVAAAHAVGVLHRDLKPDNIFIADMPDGMEPVPKVLDFGLAKLCSPADKLTQLSVAGIAMGTYQFMAPEQLRAQGEEDERTDVYALGAILFNLVAGRLPYEADNPVDLALLMMSAEPPLLNNFANVGDAAAAVVARALALQPAQRFASVEAFAKALEPHAGGAAFRGGAFVSNAPKPLAHHALSLTEQFSRPLATPFVPRTRKAVRRPRWPWVLSAVFATAAVALGGWLLASGPRTTPASATQAVASPEAPRAPAAVYPSANAQPSSALSPAELPAAAPAPLTPSPGGAPPTAIPISPAATTPLPGRALEDEGLVLIERVAPEAPPPVEEWPNARPDPSSRPPHSHRSSRHLGREMASQREARERVLADPMHPSVSTRDDFERTPPGAAPNASAPASPTTEPSSPAPVLRARSARSGLTLDEGQF